MKKKTLAETRNRTRLEKEPRKRPTEWEVPPSVHLF